MKKTSKRDAKIELTTGQKAAATKGPKACRAAAAKAWETRRKNERRAKRAGRAAK